MDRRLIVFVNPFHPKDVREIFNCSGRESITKNTFKHCSHSNNALGNLTCRIQNPDIPLAGRVGAPGGAGSGKIGCQQKYSPRKQKSTVLSKASRKHRFNVSPEARTTEILCKPTEEQNDRLTRGLSAGREALFDPGCRPVERRLFVSVNPFHARHVREFD